MWLMSNLSTENCEHIMPIYTDRMRGKGSVDFFLSKISLMQEIVTSG